MQYRYAVIDRMMGGLGDGAAYDDPRKIVSRHATHDAAERAAQRRGGDRYAIIEIVSPATAAARALGRLGGAAATPAQAAAGRENGKRGGRPRKPTATPRRA